jgi:sucrose-6-phosphate hydrolase SacC (GH32 family)
MAKYLLNSLNLLKKTLMLGLMSLIAYAIKTTLNELQGGLCVYCEQELSPNDGKIIVMPIPGLTRERKHQITQTSKMLGLNNATLSEERFKSIEVIKSIFNSCPEEDQQELLQSYLQKNPFRYIFKNYLD